MITAEDRQRIRSEEIFREEVRRELLKDGPKSQAQRIWSLLNTSFVIWFLSSILIGIVTWSYSSIEDSLRATASDRETLQKLDIEITGRLVGSEATIEITRKKHLAGSQYLSSGALFQSVVDSLNGGEYVSYDEYKGRSFPTLLIEIQRFVQPNERSKIQGALAGFSELRSDADSDVKSGCLAACNSSAEDIQKAIDTLDAAKKIVDEKIWLPRWKQNS
jgi:hypothetical protein